MMVDQGVAMRTWRVVWIVALAGSGCVRNTDGLTRDEAKAAGDALGNGIEDAAATYGPMTTAAADTTCTTFTGDTSDPDGDLVPTNATLTYNCTAMALGYTGMLTGTISVADDLPQLLAWAFTGTADMHASLTGPGNGSITSDWMGDLVASQRSAIGPYVLERTLDVTTEFRTGGGDLGGGEARTTTVTEDNEWTITYTPQVSWTPGGLVVTGSLTATGRWDVHVDEKNFASDLSTPTALTIDPVCATLITAGVVVGTDAAAEGQSAETITVTWTGCGQRTVTRGP
jgi:hypothetical protein